MEESEKNILSEVTQIQKDKCLILSVPISVSVTLSVSVLVSLSVEAPSFKSSEMRTYSGVTADIRKIK